MSVSEQFWPEDPNSSPRWKWSITTNKWEIIPESIASSPIGYTHTYSNIKPSNPLAGDEWTDTSTSKLITYRYVNDGDSVQWVQLTPTFG